MQVSIEPALLERTVFHGTRADPELAEAYQREFAGCYREAAGERRDRLFAALHERWFDRLGLRKRLLDPVEEFPNITRRINRFVAVDARARTRSGAELFGREDRLALVLALTPGLLLKASVFEEWARFELQHIEDMLNPSFGYDVDLRPGGASPARANLAHDRFNVLWALSIDARLHPCSASADQVQQTRYKEFLRAFQLPDTQKTRDEFQVQWDEFRRTMPTHALLVKWAERGVPGLRHEPEDSVSHMPPPGGRCALCGFSTFDWASLADATDVVVGLIQSDFPAWTPDQAICKRCDEIYRDRLRSSRAMAASIREIGA